MTGRGAMLLLLGAAAAAPGIFPVSAQEAPRTMPTRDVDVVYRANAGGQPVEQRTRFGLAEQKIRIDTPTPGIYLIVDRAARRMDMVSDTQRGVTEMPYDASRAGAMIEGAGLVRVGPAQVAGTGCTEWAKTDPSGQVLTACLTADGVLLRVRAGDKVLVEAARVAYGTIDPAVFVIPPGYQRTAARR